MRAPSLRFIALVMTAAAQQLPPVQPPPFRVGVDAVQLDVSVLDKARRPVRGLAAADFTVLEDGKPRRIVAFSAIDLSAAPAAAVPSGADTIAPDVAHNDLPDGRIVVILMDYQLRESAASVMALRTAARLVDGLGPGDLGAVAHTMFGTSQNLTTDRARLKAAIASSGMATVRPDEPDAESGSCQCGLCKVEAMTRIAEAVRDEPQRRKTVFYVGERFPAYPGGTPCDTYLEPAIRTMIQATQLANLTVHAVDPNGLEVTSVGASDTFRNDPNRSDSVSAAARQKAAANRASLIERQQSLRALTDVTGGRAIMNTNAPEQSLRAILDESSAYYLLAFQGDAVKPDGRFRPITVKVNRPGVEVRTRKGYYAGPAPSGATDHVPLEAVLRGLLPERGLPMNVAAAPFRGSNGTPVLIITAGMKRGAERPSPEPRATDAQPPQFEPIEILTGAFRDARKDVEWQRQRLSIALPESEPGQLRYETISTLPLKPGSYELRVAARHERAGDVGSVHAYVDVPDFAGAGPTLSGVVVLDPRAPTATPPEALAGILDTAPTTRREFSRADEVSALVRVYQRQQRPPTAVSFRVLDGALREVLSAQALAQPGGLAGAGAADARYPLPLAALQPGSYVLRVETSGVRGPHRDVRFTVR